MKVYQCIHKYEPHIPEFEKRHGINDDTDISFEELRRLVIEDGYASAYILKPALEHKANEVFFTIWNYDRLQFLWAKENGLTTNDLDEIKLAQIQKFAPDVFYNMSPFIDNNFIELLKINNIKCKTICWNGFVEKRPNTNPFYDVHLTLHKPFVSYWKKLGLRAHEFQPAIPEKWAFNNFNRSIDILFYGQYFESIFSERNKIVNSLVKFKLTTQFNLRIHLSYNLVKIPLIKFPKIRINRIIYPKKIVRNYTEPPLFGEALYNALSNTKIVINAYGDYNRDYKNNMRLFETIGHGAFLISERGNYPDGFEPDVDFYTYEGFEELIEKIEYVLDNWDKHHEIAFRTANKIRKLYSKERQWEHFQKIVSEIS